MDKLLESICVLVSNQHPNQIRSLANKARSLSSTDAGRLDGHFNTQAANHLLSEVIKEWSQVDCSGEELAGLLLGASHGYMNERARESVELVWSGPDTHHVPVRRSEQVYNVIDIKELVVNKQYSGVILIGYRNEKLKVDETRSFRVLAENDELPPKGSLVIILGDEPLVGRYMWQKQQSMDGDRTYYSVTMRGQSRSNAIEVEEKDWPNFRPFAAEVS